MIKKINILLKVSLIFFLSTANVFAELKEELIKKLILTKTLSFDFKQKVEEKEERGSCFIKYPLLMRCNYTNVKEKILMMNPLEEALEWL